MTDQNTRQILLKSAKLYFCYGFVEFSRLCLQIFCAAAIWRIFFEKFPFSNNFENMVNIKYTDCVSLATLKMRVFLARRAATKRREEFDVLAARCLLPLRMEIKSL